MLISEIGVDCDTHQALEELKKVKFLPMRGENGCLMLVGVEDEFAIPDHGRYGKAFQDKGVLHDFSLGDKQILNTLIQHLGLTGRYLYSAVCEESDVGDDACLDVPESTIFQNKAYALYR